MKLGGLLGGGSQGEGCCATAGTADEETRKLSSDVSFLGRHLVKVRIIRGLRKEEIACLAKSADFPSITSSDL